MSNSRSVGVDRKLHLSNLRTTAMSASPQARDSRSCASALSCLFAHTLELAVHFLGLGRIERVENNDHAIE